MKPMNAQLWTLIFIAKSILKPAFWSKQKPWEEIWIKASQLVIATRGNIFTVGLQSWHLLTAETKLLTLLTRTLVIAVWKSKKSTYLFYNRFEETQCDTPCRLSHRTSTGTTPFISFLSCSGIFCAVDTSSRHLQPKFLKIQKTTALTYFYITPCHHIRQKVLTRIRPPGICRRLRNRQIEITLFQIML